MTKTGPQKVRDLWQRKDLGDYGAEFARWFRESTLHQSGAVDETLRSLEARGAVYRSVHPESGHERPTIKTFDTTADSARFG